MTERDQEIFDYFKSRYAQGQLQEEDIRSLLKTANDVDAILDAMAKEQIEPKRRPTVGRFT